jgi:hypothetical protein
MLWKEFDVRSSKSALAKGSAVAQYNWNGGQTFNGKPWNHEEQPSDAQVRLF